MVGELSGTELTLKLSRASRPLQWLEQAATDPSTLMLASLDTTEENSWLVYIVDTRRRRAALRRVTGGSERNAAALEAVASIVASAASALSDGLLVASKRLDEVLPESSIEPRGKPSGGGSSAARAEGASGAGSEAAGGGLTLDSGARSERPSAVVEADAVFDGFFGASVASFEQSAKLTFGPTLSLGILYHGLFSLRVSGSRHFPESIETELGVFSVTRSHLWASLGLRWASHRFYAEPGALVGGELVERHSAVPNEQALAAPGGTSFRFGAGIGTQVGFQLTQSLAAEVSLNLAYYPRKLSFTELGTAQALATPYRLVGIGGFGFGVRFP